MATFGKRAKKIGQVILGILGGAASIAIVVGLYWGIFKLLAMIDTSNFWAQRIIIFLLGIGGGAAGLLLARETKEKAERKKLGRVISIIEKHIAQIKGPKDISVSSVRSSEISSIMFYLEPETSLVILQCVDCIERIAAANASNKDEDNEHLVKLYKTFILPATSELEKAREKLSK